MKLLIKYTAFLILMSFSVASVSWNCPDTDFVKDPKNRWNDGFEAGIKDAGFGSGTLFLAGGSPEISNLDNVTQFLQARILNDTLTCIYNGDVLLITPPRYKYRPTNGAWRNIICPTGGTNCRVCISSIADSCQFNFS